MVGVPFASDFCRIRCRRMRWVLQWLPWVRTVLWCLSGERALLRGLPGLRHGGGWRSAVLYSRCWLLRGPRLLRLEAWTLGMARRSKSLDPRTLRFEISELRAAGSLVSARAFRKSRSISTEACYGGFGCLATTLRFRLARWGLLRFIA